MKRLLVMLFLATLAAPASAAKVVVVALFKDKAMVSIDGKQRLLRAGQTSPEGVTLISADAEEAVLEVGGERGTYRLGAQIASSFARPELRIPQSPSGLYRVDGYINGQPVGFVVDTGATLVTLNARLAARIGIDYRAGQEAPFTTALGDSTVFVVPLERVQIGDIVLQAVSGAVHEGEFPADVLLGQSFLGRLEMRREGRALVLSQ